MVHYREMHELHEKERRFFDAETLERLGVLVRGPCCLCAPMLGKQLTGDGVSVTILDCDVRFAHLPGFRKFALCSE
ncbi:MAG: hypothetical protein O7H41_05365 [Planctomycetota bacterium]|nr:hypothetical protein [Planctomycetota bacterium]